MNNILFVGEHLRTYSVQWHKHNYWELVYCTGGEGIFEFENGTTLHYKEGEVVAIPPEELHTNSSPAGFTNIHITMAEPAFPFRGIFRVNDDKEGRLRRAFSDARYFYLMDMKKKEMILAALGDLISSYMVVFHSNHGYSEPVERIKSQIIEHYPEADFALDDVIRSMPFHYDYLRKLFKKEVGVTPLEYMTGLRMKKAETLLGSMNNHEYSMSEIGRMCGFEDALYFSRVFKKCYGCSPSHFAQNAESKD